MLQANVAINTRKVNDRTGILDIQGEVSSGAERALIDAYDRLSAANAHTIILNMSGLTYMNSSGIGLLVTLLIWSGRQKQKLLAYGLPEHYRKIFALTRLNDAIGVFNSEADAVAAAGQAETRLAQSFPMKGINQTGTYASL